MTNELEGRLQAFASWARSSYPALRSESAEAIANQLGDALLRIDDRLGVEVAQSEDGGNREIIITAFSNAEAFDLVRRVVGLLAGFDGWRFVALKPPRGFAFTIKLGRCAVDVKDMEFAPLKDISGGIRLILSADANDHLPLGRDREELAWLIVESGIGEELAEKLQHIEFGARLEADEKYPIAALAEYLRKPRAP